MTDTETTAAQSSGTIDEYFFIEGHLLSTRTSDAYKAIDKFSKASVLLWRLRHPLDSKSGGIGRFLARMKILTSITPAVADIESYEVDANGVAFAVLPQLHGQALSAVKLEVTEAERQFVSCLRLVAQLHEQGVVCGDLCPASFWLDRSGDLMFLGIMGSFDSEASGTATLPAPELLNYMAPEQRSGAGAVPASDVFALAVLGYHFFTGQFPYGAHSGVLGEADLASLKPVSQFVPKAPSWTEDFFQKALHPDPEARYATVEQMLKGLVELRQKKIDEANVPARVGMSLSAQEKIRRAASVHMPVSQSAKVREQAQEAEEAAAADAATKRSNPKLMAGLGVVCIIAIGIILKFAFGRDEIQKQEGVKFEGILAEGADPDLTAPLVEASSCEITPAELKDRLDAIIKSDDPIMLAGLVSLAKAACTSQQRGLVEEAILARAKRVGLTRSSVQANLWLKSNSEAQSKTPAYGAVLKTLDPSMPRDDRNALLKEAYPTDPRAILRLIGALAIDLGKPDDFQALLASLLQDPLDAQDLKTRSTLSMILAYSELSLVFGEDAMLLKDKIPDGDVLWLLGIMAERGDAQLKTLATMAGERNLLPPLRQIFLEPLIAKADLPVDVSASLIKGTAGTLKKDDVTRFGRWYHPDVEKVLLAVCADRYDREVIVEAFEILAGKNPVLPPTAELINWVRKDYWEQRGDFAHAIGILGTLSVATAEEVEPAMAIFSKFLGDQRFMSALLATNSPVIIKLMLDKAQYSARLLKDPFELLKLAEFPDKEIRKKAVELAGKRNDMLIIKRLMELYEVEKDPEVRKVYESNPWILERVKK